MSRKDTLRSLLTARDRTLPDGNPGEEGARPIPEGEAPPQHVRSGAVGAMGRSLGKITHAAQEARALVAAGEAVVDLDPALIDLSFVSDRLGGAPADHAALTESIRTHGQQVPILVRPHPGKAGRYQVAYGHRRLLAAAELGKRVRAVVRQLSDADLVVAQGQENSARLDLSYIERALFAAAIEDKGFDRSVAMAALHVEKTQLSRLLAVARSIPVDIIRLIGAAPATGRPRWTALADLIASGVSIEPLGRLADDPGFRALDSDAKFGRVVAALRAPPLSRPAKTVWKDAAGRSLVHFRREEGRAQVVVDERLAPAFGDFIMSQMTALFQAYQLRKP